MNKVVLMGRLVRDPEVRYSGEMAIARYTLAVDRRFKRDGEPTADFIGCVSFDKLAKFAEKYLYKGIKVAVTGRIQTGSYTDKDGKTVYTTDVVLEECEFAESKSSSNNSETRNDRPSSSMPTDANGFMSIPDGIDDELPFA